MDAKLIPCRVCGALYPPCKNCEDDKSMFHWREVACSYEHGQEYLRREMERRSAAERSLIAESIPEKPTEDPKKPVRKKSSKSKKSIDAAAE
jgi:hypothetical protein